jgi:hypothetical protein
MNFARGAHAERAARHLSRQGLPLKHNAAPLADPASDTPHLERPDQSKHVVLLGPSLQVPNWFVVGS